MHLGIYRPGQGYWVRVLTAVGAGVLVLATAGWVYAQMAAIRVPVKRWDITVQINQGQVAPSEAVQLFNSDDATEPFATGTLAQSVDLISSTVLQITDVVLSNDEIDPSETQVVRTLGGFEAVPTSQTSVAKVQLFEQIYLQAGMAAIVIVIGAFIVYSFVAKKRGSVDFLVATDGEMKKVNWSTKRDVYRSTIVVVFSSLVIAGGLFVVDSAFAWFFRLTNVLQQ